MEALETWSDFMLVAYLSNSFGDEDVCVLELELSYYCNSMSITEEKDWQDDGNMERFISVKINFTLVMTTDVAIY